MTYLSAKWWQICAMKHQPVHTSHQYGCRTWRRIRRFEGLKEVATEYAFALATVGLTDTLDLQRKPSQQTLNNCCFAYSSTKNPPDGRAFLRLSRNDRISSDAVLPVAFQRLPDHEAVAFRQVLTEDFQALKPFFSFFRPSTRTDASKIAN